MTLLRTPSGALFFVVAFLSGLVGCGSARTRDFAGGRRAQPTDGKTTLGVAEPPAPAKQETKYGSKMRVVARATSRAMATAGDLLYYGDSSTDALYVVSKAGGAPTRLAYRAPMTGAIAIDGDDVTWVGSPGDVVLRTKRTAGSSATLPSTLKERAIFTDVAAQNGDVYVAEVVGDGGAIFRLGGTSPTKVGAFETSPRAITADTKSIFVATSSRLLKVSRQNGDVATIASGNRFDSPLLQGDDVYAVATPSRGPRTIVRVSKEGGVVSTLVDEVRDAPIAIGKNRLFYVDGNKTELRMKALDSTDAHVIARDDALGQVLAIVADDTTVYVCVADGESSSVLAIAI